jgi:hypothetical protein
MNQMDQRQRFEQSPLLHDFVAWTLNTSQDL